MLPELEFDARCEFFLGTKGVSGACAKVGGGGVVQQQKLALLLFLLP